MLDITYGMQLTARSTGFAAGVRAACAVTVAFVAVMATVRAHGGQFRGPGSATPGTPGPAGPLTPGGSGPSTGARGAASSDWRSWWEFNKDPFLNLKEAIHATGVISSSDEFFMGFSRRAPARDTLAPTRSQIVHSVLPALKRQLDRTRQRDIVSACLVALGKIGVDHPEFGILDIMRPHLASKDQEIRETAALAMGISQLPAAVPDLTALATDSQAGRALCRRPEVDDRTRAFACYGLGLVASGSDDGRLKRRCFLTLASVLRATTERLVDRNVPVAAIGAIGIVRPDSDRLRDDCVYALWSYYRKRVGPGDQAVQSHVPPAVARLLGRGAADVVQYKDAFAAELTGERGKRHQTIYQSAAIALGVLCEAPEVAPGDAKYSEVLWKTYRDGVDEQTRWFCAMALGEIGGAANRDALLVALAKGSKAIAKPWAALALGVLGFRARERGEPDLAVSRALRSELVALKNPQTQSAVAIALGLCGHRDAAGDLEELLADNQQQDQLAGYLCLALALMDSRRSIEPIRELVAGATRRPELLKQAAIALGKLGDKEAADQLQTMLRQPPINVAKLGAVAAALGFIGDRRSIRPLIAMLQDDGLTPLSRAFAAVALGGVGDKEPLPWNSKLAVHSNYRAAVETLTNGASGVLDIL